MSPEEYKMNREKLGLSQTALARRLDVSREIVNKREHGKRRITKEAALAILQLVSYSNAQVMAAPLAGATVETEVEP
jgi:DNA-binding transcriptional regulator YiaG